MMQEDYFEQMRTYYHDWKLDYTRYYPFYIKMSVTEQLLQITNVVISLQAKLNLVKIYDESKRI